MFNGIFLKKMPCSFFQFLIRSSADIRIAVLTSSRLQSGEERCQDQKACACHRKPEADRKRRESGEIDCKRSHQQNKCDYPR